MTRATITAQARWAAGQAVQHRRIASRAAPGSQARSHALAQAAMADAATRSLQSMAAFGRALSPETRP